VLDLNLASAELVRGIEVSSGESEVSAHDMEERIGARKTQ
jgi:hypothetical protein